MLKGTDLSAKDKVGVLKYAVTIINTLDALPDKAVTDTRQADDKVKKGNR